MLCDLNYVQDRFVTKEAHLADRDCYSTDPSPSLSLAHSGLKLSEPHNSEDNTWAALNVLPQNSNQWDEDAIKGMTANLNRSPPRSTNMSSKSTAGASTLGDSSGMSGSAKNELYGLDLGDLPVSGKE